MARAAGRQIPAPGGTLSFLTTGAAQQRAGAACPGSDALSTASENPGQQGSAHLSLPPH